MQIPSCINSPEWGLADEIRKFEERHGQFVFIRKKERLMSNIIDEAYLKMWHRQLSCAT